MVKRREHLTYHLEYRLLKLVLVLPVATATVERIFSAMKVVKTNLRNHMGDQYMSNSHTCYVEKEKMMKVTNKVVVDLLKKMAEHNTRSRRQGIAFSFFIIFLFININIQPLKNIESSN